MDPGWIVAAVSLATLVLGAVGWLGRKVWHALVRLMRFLDDFYGEPGAPGRPERPGVMMRLQRLETTGDEISRQVHLDSGTSLKDAVARTESKVGDLHTAVETLSRRVEQIANGGKNP